MKPKINIISCLMYKNLYVESFLNQLKCLSHNNYLLNKIILLCDDVQNFKKKFKGKYDKSVILVQENNANTDFMNFYTDKVQHWSNICNDLIDESLNYHSDYTFFIESDISFPFDVLDQLVLNKVDICSPVIFVGSSFYDTWAFRDLNDQTLDFKEIIHNHTYPLPLKEMSSVGSCVLFKSKIFSKALIRFRPSHSDGLLKGVCLDARKKNFRTWVDMNVSIIHPTSSWRNQVWKINYLSYSIDNHMIKEKIDTGFFWTIGHDFLKNWIHNHLNKIDNFPNGEYMVQLVLNTKKRIFNLKISSHLKKYDFIITR